MDFKHKYIGYLGKPVGTNSDPVEYKGYLIYERILTEQSYRPYYISRKKTWENHESVLQTTIWSVVKDGKEISQLAGPNGAKSAIDQMLEENNLT